MNWIWALVASVGTLGALWPAGHLERSGNEVASRPRAGGSRRARERSVRGRSGVNAADVAGSCELLSVAVASGCTPAQAIMETGAVSGAGAGLADGAEQLRRGRAMEEVLDAIASRGGGWHSLAALLAIGASSGSDITDALRRVAASERTRLRRVREARARRLPIVLLLPLTGLLLPAFVLVTVVPFAVAGSEMFELPPLPDTGSEEPDQGGG